LVARRPEAFDLACLSYLEYSDLTAIDIVSHWKKGIARHANSIGKNGSDYSTLLE